MYYSDCDCQEDFDKLEKEQKLLEAELQAKLPAPLEEANFKRPWELGKIDRS